MDDFFDSSITPAQIRTLLDLAIERAGGQQALARLLGVSQWHINNAVRAGRPVSPRLARALGFNRHSRRFVRYVAISDDSG